MDVSDRRTTGHTWRYALGGAVILFAIVVFANAGGYEGGDVVLILGPFAAVIGGCPQRGGCDHPIAAATSCTSRQPPVTGTARAAGRGRASGKEASPGLDEPLRLDRQEPALASVGACQVPEVRGRSRP